MVVSARLRDTSRDILRPRRQQHMARSIRSSTLETRSARLKLPIAKKPIFLRIAPGVGLGYRRNRTAGTWVARGADGRGGNWKKGIGSGDNFAERGGSRLLDVRQTRENVYH